MTEVYKIMNLHDKETASFHETMDRYGRHISLQRAFPESFLEESQQTYVTETHKVTMLRNLPKYVIHAPNFDSFKVMEEYWENQEILYDNKHH